jgi:DNA-binding response OmpR family regulator
MMPTALIVEDEPEANKLLAMLVRLQGYDTDSAFTGSEALAKIEHDPPDIVFLDLMLPDINGYEVCRSLKTQKSTALIPVVMVTARCALENRIESYSHGAGHYVPKPYTPDQIFQAMAEADDWSRNLGRRASEGEVRLGSGEDGETVRQLAQLRCLLLAGTTLDAESFNGLTETLQQLGASADEWGRKHGMSQVAILSYRNEGTRLALTFRDLAGWLRDDPRSPVERWPEAIARGRFDDVAHDPAGGSFSLVKVIP